MNQSPGSNYWLELKLEGTKSNRDGIGAMKNLPGDQILKVKEPLP